MAGRKFAGSSVAPLAICWRSNLPALFQRLADLGLGELLLLRKIFTRVAWLTVLRDKLRRLNVLRFPIEIENLIVRPQIILGVPMAIQAPRHAVGLGDVNHRHVIDRSVATETADAPVHVRRVVVINVIDRAIEPHPLDWLDRSSSSPAPAAAWDCLSPLAYGSSCMSQCWARSIARPLPRSCDNTGNPSPVGSREYRAETAPAGSAGIRLLCTSAWRNTMWPQSSHKRSQSRRRSP